MSRLASPARSVAPVAPVPRATPVARWWRDPVLLGLAAVTAAVTGWFLSDIAGTPAQVVVFWLIQPPTDLAFFLLAGRVARLPALPAPARRFWLALAAASLLFMVGDTVQTGIAIRNPTAASAEAGAVQGTCLLIGMTLLVGVMLTYPTGLGSRRERTRFWLDAGTVMVAAAVFAWYFAVTPGGTQAGVPRVVNALLLCGMSLVAVFAVIKLVLGGSAPLTRNAAIVGAACPAIQGVANALTPVLLQTPQLNLLLAVRLLPSMLIVAAIRVQELDVSADPGVLAQRRARPYSRLPYLAVAATHILLVLILARGLDTRVWGVLVGVITITTLVVVRQLIAFTDNARLLLELRHREQRFRSLVQHATEITAIVAADGTLTYASPGIERLLGYPAATASGRDAAQYVHPDDLPQLRARLTQLIGVPRASVTYQVRARHANGSWRWLEVISTNLIDDPSVGGIVSNARDVTEAREFTERLRYQASHDTLTRLPNRALFHERLHEAAASRRRSNERIAVMLVDLDDFKAVNDTLGHHVGDALLVAVAERLAGCVRPSDTVARLGGDEFGIMLHDIAPDDTAQVVGRIMAAFAEPVSTHGHELRIHASVGVATGHPENSDTLLRDSDAAMYTAKRGGKGTYAYHSSSA